MRRVSVSLRLAVFMAGDPDRHGVTERVRLAQATSGALATVGGVMTFAQLVEYARSGKLNYILSAVFAIMAIAGIATLFTMNKRRGPLLGASMMLTILIFAVGATFFGLMPGHLPLFPAPDTAPPHSAAPSPSTAPAPEVSSSSLPPPTATNPTQPAWPDFPPNRTTSPPTMQPLPETPGNDLPTPALLPISPAPQPAARGTFTSPAPGQHVHGNQYSTAGNIEGLSSALLCIVKNESGNYFPYTAGSTSGQWSASVGIGPPTINRPLQFTFILATATPSALDEIADRRQANPDYYNQYGLGRHLPSGIETLAEVAIVRTS